MLWKQRGTEVRKAMEEMDRKGGLSQVSEIPRKCIGKRDLVKSLRFQGNG